MTGNAAVMTWTLLIVRRKPVIHLFSDHHVPSLHLPYPDAHRNLHSFPTRRSSDLSRRGLVLPDRRSPLVNWRARGPRFPIRSEEHTSELQSHHDLVCRLLLEKKNRYTAAVPRLFSTHPCATACLPVVRSSPPSRSAL